MVPIRFTAPGGLDLARGYVAVIGQSVQANSSSLFSASVPKLLWDNGRLYMYWSMVQMPKGSVGIQDWISITTRGIELVKMRSPAGFPKDTGLNSRPITL